MSFRNWVHNRWNKQPRRNKLIGGIMLCSVAIFMFIIRCTQTPVNNKNDLEFIRGSISTYNFTDGSRGFHDYTFHLQGYPNLFQISADFVTFFRYKQFQNLQYGDTITIGISRKDYDNLEVEKNQRILVFAITNQTTTFLDANKALQKYNSFFPYYASVFFLLMSIVFIYSFYRSKYTGT